MALFNEQFPYVNAHQLNLDWVLEKIKEFDAKVTEFQETLTQFGNRLDTVDETVAALQSAVSTAVLDITDLKNRVQTNEGDISDLKTRVQTIEGQITSIGTSITTLTNEIQRVEAESVSRDNNLGNRVSLLESAVINPIDIYNASENLVLAGDFLQYLPIPSGRNMPYGVPEHNNNWSYDEKGFYSTSNWNDLYFDCQYTLPTTGGGTTLSGTYTVTLIFMTKTNIDASPYNVANPSFWIVESHAFTTAERVATENISGIQYGIGNNGTINIRNVSAGNMANSYRLVAVKCEKGNTSSGIQLNKRDKLLMDFALNYGGAGSTPTHYTGSYTMNVDSLDTDPEITWADSPYFTVSVDLYKAGNIVQGSLKFVLGSGQSEAITMSNLVTTAKNLNVSALGLPATKTPGAAIGSYNDILNREQYLVYGANTSNTLTSMNVFPYFVSKTTAADGTIVEIPIAYVC